MLENEIVADQLELLGLEEMRRRAEFAPTKSVRSRLLRRVETAHDLLTALPTSEDSASSTAVFAKPAFLIPGRPRITPLAAREWPFHFARDTWRRGRRESQYSAEQQEQEETADHRRGRGRLLRRRPIWDKSPPNYDLSTD